MQENISLSKRFLGQFFTIANPFNLSPFDSWLTSIPDIDKTTLLEPFAGANNIVNMMQSLGYTQPWKCFDICLSEKNMAPDFSIEMRDTLKDFPTGFNVAITNPPYLAKNSATRRNLPYPDTQYDDLYKYCLDIMLQHVGYAAAIIPESFITSGLFHDRLTAVISLTCKMFDDTDCPVCLALFTPPEYVLNDDFNIYRLERYLGTYNKLKDSISISDYQKIDWRFNDPDGTVGIYCLDNTARPTIRFVVGNAIDAATIKVSSRGITRVGGLPSNVDINKFLAKCNELLVNYREATSDVFLTCFKGLRSDGQYRRRLDFKTAKNILNMAADNLGV